MPEPLADQVLHRLGEVPSRIHGDISGNFKKLCNLLTDDEGLPAKARDGWYVPDPNKTGDLEQPRDRALLRAFAQDRAPGSRRLKVSRLEAVRAGLRKAWAERTCVTIFAVARKIPENALEEEPNILMWYEQALNRSGEE